MRIEELDRQFRAFRATTTFPSLREACAKDFLAVSAGVQLKAFLEKLSQTTPFEVAETGRALVDFAGRSLDTPFTGIVEGIKPVVARLESKIAEYRRQMAVVRQLEDTGAQRDDLLAAYEKAYAIIPDPALGQKIGRLKH